MAWHADAPVGGDNFAIAQRVGGLVYWAMSDSPQHGGPGRRMRVALVSKRVAGGWSRRWAAAWGVLALCGCAVEPHVTEVAGQTLPTVAPASAGVADTEAGSALGSYLAGRIARLHGDTTAASDYFERALKADPTNQRLVRNAFIVMLAEGRMSQAMELADRLVKSEPNGALANLTLAVSAIGRRDFSAALDRLEKAPQRRFNALAIPLITSWALVGKGEPDNAIKTVTTISKRKSFAGLRALHTALIHDLAGRPAEAEANYRAALEERRNGAVRVAEAFGNFLEREGKTEEAAELYCEAQTDEPSHPLIEEALDRVTAGKPAQPLIDGAIAGAAEALFGMAGKLARDGAVESAAVYAHLAIHLRPEFAGAQMLRGNILETNQRWEMAIAAYRAIDTRSAYAWNARIRIATNLNRLDRGDQAIAQLYELANERVDDTDALISLGNLYRAKEKWMEAIAQYDRAIARIETLTENDWPLLYTRGIALERAKLWPRAEADFLRALELKPDQPLVLNYLGYSWVDQGRNFERALSMIQRAVDLRPRDGYIVDSLGWVLYRLGRHEQAVKQLERAVELRSEDPVINDHLGDAYWRVGRTNEARFQWRRALSFEPDENLVPVIETKVRRRAASERTARP